MSNTYPGISTWQAPTGATVIIFQDADGHSDQIQIFEKQGAWIADDIVLEGVVWDTLEEAIEAVSTFVRDSFDVPID